MYWRQCAVTRLQLRCDAGGRPPRVVSVEQRPRYWRRLDDVLWHVGRTEIRTTMLGLKLSLYVNALLEEYALE